jgi:hypothetical protein
LSIQPHYRGELNSVDSSESLTAIAALMNPEERVRQSIDWLLTAAGWSVQDFKTADIHVAQGVAPREFPLFSPSPLAGEWHRSGGWAGPPPDG